jgi:phospholipase A1
MIKIVVLILICLSAFASELDDLYTDAQELEINGQYKEAMHLYKQIAKKERTSNRTYLDENKRKAIQVVRKTINTIEDKQTVENIEQMLASSFDLYPYHENYLLPFSYDTKKRSDREQFETKFQLSVKKPISHNLFGFNETINFGYTHTSWWQIYDESSPFRETNYKPEFFVTVPYGKSDKTSLKGFKLGFLHESNGQKEEKSRSWNRIYLESYFQAGNLFAIPKIWYRVPEKKDEDDNPNIDDYLGYGDLTLIYPYKKHTFKLLLRNNLKLDNNNKGFVEFDWTFPFFNSKSTFGYIQLSNGYGDSLIDYDKEISRISFGISLSR